MLKLITRQHLAAAKERATRVENCKSLHFHPNRRVARKNMADLIKENRKWFAGRMGQAKKGNCCYRFPEFLQDHYEIIGVP